MAMFGKLPPVPGEQPQAPSAPLPPRSAVVAVKTLVGSGTRVVGELFADEDVVIEGRLEGKIRGERGVTVGSAGDVEGDIQGKTVTVGGKVRGQVVAVERVELTGTAVVEGGVQAPKIIIAEGAVLQGNIAMSSGGPAARRPEPRPEE